MAGGDCTGVGGVCGEIPAASAGMTDLASAGVMELACAGVTELACAGMTEVGRGVALGARAARYPRQARV